MQYDLIIVGGGIVGTSLALSLQDLSLNIALVDATPVNQTDPRQFALHAGSCQFLQNLAIWPELVAAACPIHQVHVSSQGQFGAVRLTREAVNLPVLGHVVPAHVINIALEKALQKLKQTTVFRPARLKTLQHENDIAILEIEAEGKLLKLQSSIVIAADGTYSTARDQLGVATKIFDYQQTALVTQTHLLRSHQHIAYERFTKRGTIAMLPLTSQRCATIWSADNEQITKLMALSEESFLAELQKQFGFRLGRLAGIQQRFTFPLKMLKTNHYREKSVLLLGNAAHTLHPVAGQGLNLALYEVACLAEAINDNQPSLTIDILEQSLQRAHQQQTASTNLSHYLASFFEKNSIFMKFAQQLGMIGLDSIPFAKRRFIQQMTGKTGRVPKLFN